MSANDKELPEFEGAPDASGDSSGGMNHLVNTYKRCPVEPKHEGFEVRNYSVMWHDGEVHCAQCGAYIREYDAG